MSSQITVQLNGTAHTLDAGTSLASLLADAGIGPDRRGVAVAVGDEVVRRAEWSERVLSDGDHVEVVTATQGG